MPDATTPDHDQRLKVLLKEHLQGFLSIKQNQEVQSLMTTTYERGIERGIEQGIERGILQGERRAALRLLEAKFGPFSAEVKQRVEALSLDQLQQLMLDLLKAQSLKDLRLEE